MQISYEIKAIDNIVCLPGTGILRAVVTTKEDISPLFPYINGYLKKVRYLPGIPWIRFPFEGFPHNLPARYEIACKRNEIILGKFSSNEEAVDVIVQLIDFLHHIDREKSKITPSYKEWNPPSAIEIFKFLPQTNCKKCGYRTCMAFAVKLAQGDAEPEECPSIDEKKLAELKEIL